MPSSRDQSGLVLELTRLASSSGVTLKSIAQLPSAEGAGGTTVIPVVVSVGGRFRDISRFLQRTRSLVTVRRGSLRATGRLLTVQRVELVQSATATFPQLDATITLNAFVYDGPIVAPQLPPTGDAQDQTSGGTAAAGVTH
jgi:Tfp pilus assembly protein PilO